LNTLVKDIERCEKTMTSLKTETGSGDSKYPGPRTTREDIAYLTDLLDCAKKKTCVGKTDNQPSKAHT